MSQSPASLLARVRHLELASRRNTVGAVAGDYLSAIKGQGMVFHESRKYVGGEPARRIDWNVTARLGEPYVKVHLDERQREVVLAVDLSPSMHMGSQERTKLELAVELAATLAVSVIDAGDRLGHVLFADRVLNQARPGAGRRQLFSTLSALLKHVGPWERRVAVSDPRQAIHAIEGFGRRRMVIFLISDFVDHDLPEDLRYLRLRHDVSMLHVYDPLELGEVSEAVTFRAMAPEGEPGPRRLRPGQAGSLEGTMATLANACGRIGLGLASFSTAEPPHLALARFLHRRRRRPAR